MEKTIPYLVKLEKSKHCVEYYDEFYRENFEPDAAWYEF